MIVARRAALATMLGALAATWTPATVAQPSRGAAAPARRRAAQRRWGTGSRMLVPLSAAGARVLFAGERMLGAISLDQAEPLWIVPHGLARGAAFRPRAAGRRVVCGGPDAIVCRSLDDGTPGWRYAAKVQTGVPLVGHDRTFVGDGHEIVALDNATGSPVWRFAGIADTLASYAPAALGDTILAGPGDGRLYALAAGDGHLRWVIDRGSEWQYLRQLHVSGRMLIAGSYTERLYGISIDDGTVRWSFNAGNFINSHHVADAAAYLWSPTGWIYAIETASGAVRWRHRTTGYSGAAGDWASVLAELVTDEGRLYALAMDDVLHVLDTASGNEIERFALPERVRPSVLPMSGRGLAFAAVQGDVFLVAG